MPVPLSPLVSILRICFLKEINIELGGKRFSQFMPGIVAKQRMNGKLDYKTCFTGDLSDVTQARLTMKR